MVRLGCTLSPPSRCHPLWQDGSLCRTNFINFNKVDFFGVDPVRSFVVVLFTFRSMIHIESILFSV